MFAKTLIASATAAVIAAGALTVTTGSASATSYKAGHYVTKVVYVPKKVCEPVYKTIKWHDYYGWHTKTVYAGEKCYTVTVKAYQKVWVPYVTFNYSTPHFSLSYGY